MGSENKVLNFTEVSVHNNPKDCWLIINAKAYDVTKFLDDHPGGDEVLLEVSGQDATEEFEAAGHGSAARLMLDEYYVAEIDPTSTPVTKTTNPAIFTRNATPEPPPKDEEEDNKSSNFMIIKLILFLAVLGLAIGIRYYV